MVYTNERVKPPVLSLEPQSQRGLVRLVLMNLNLVFVTAAIASFTIPPTITSQPQSITTRIGASATFSVEATGSFPLRFQWQKNGANILGATASILGLGTLNQSDAATYTVIVSNDFGTVTSAPARLTLTTPLFISQEPTNQVVKAGADARFSVQATSGLPLAYYWFRDGVLIPNAVSNVLTVKNVQAVDIGNYSAVIYTTQGGFRSQSAALTISGAVPPSITVHPLSRTNLIGTSSTFTVGASGGLPFSYQWHKSGLVLTNAVGSNLVLSAVTESDFGSYHVVVTNIAGTASSAPGFLTVHFPPEIRLQPTNRTVFAGTFPSFSIDAHGAPSPSYQWFKNGAAIPGATFSILTLFNAKSSDSGKYFAVVTNLVGKMTSAVARLTVQVPTRIAAQPVSQNVFIDREASLGIGVEGDPPIYVQWFKGTNAIPSATNSFLTFTNAQLSDAGSYSVVVSNAFAKVTSIPAVLAVNIPVVITSHPTNQVLVLSSNALFSVRATGFGTLRYQWFKDKQSMLNGQGQDLTLPRIQASDAGNYFAVVRGDFGAATSSVARLTINFPPSIRSQPQNQIVGVGIAAQFSADVAGNAPLAYRWFKNDIALTNATNAVLTFPQAQFSDQAVYRYVVTNMFGAVTSLIARLTVNAPPSIRLQPVGTLGKSGSSASFMVEADGSPPLDYQWFRNHQFLTSATNRVLELKNLSLNDEGDYRVVVSNAFGIAESVRARLAVGLVLSILRQPVTQTANVGGTVTFTVGVEGMPPLSCQWFKNDKAIAAATNSVLTLRDLKPRDAAKYAVNVSHPFGELRSSEANLFIRTPLAVKGDFSGDGSPDLVFQNNDGSLASWHLTGTEMTSFGPLIPGSPSAPGWRIRGSGDFNRDAREDLILQHADGTLAVWFMNGRVLLDGALLKVQIVRTEETKITATGDFNEDGNTDVVLQSADRRLTIGFVDRLRIDTALPLNSGNPVDADWAVAGAGDFDEDGKLDLVFQHTSGTLGVWCLDGAVTKTVRVMAPSHPGDSAWRVVSITDRNADGLPDLLFQHERDGTLGVWFMEGAKLNEARGVNPPRPGSSWRVVAP